jgi:nucleotide-binding universal stress UspA family protein
MTAPVVVGLDDLEQSARAVAAAAREAELRGAPLWVGHAYQWIPPVASGILPGGDTPAGAVRDAADDLLVTTVKQVHHDHPDLDVHSYAMSGPAATCLADLAEEAALLVVGGRGRGGFAGLALGSVALRTLAHARCPVLVVRGEEQPAADRVLVGVDVSEPDGTARLLEFAFEEAELRDAALVAVHALEDPSALYPAAIGPYPREYVEAMSGERQHRLDTVLTQWRERFAGVVATSRVVIGAPARSLVEVSAKGDLLVIGARRHRDGEGMRLGGVAHAVLRHAHQPVVVVPED